MLVHILLFNAGTENEGIHTIQIGDRNTILMFQDEDDAIRYGGLLEAQDFPEAKVEAIDSEEVEQFCRQADYDWKMVEPGQLEIPPEKNVEELSWEQEEEAQITDSPPEEGTIASDELDRIRQQLEGLL
ncbi:DUF3110 domain-containing protein [Waterburya agarophytonicola K14]|uniref:DUF3110 domain-containing protein n=1 Tax=Waterburya agarophytonicola KI4 TaxID=2874699 RepID=A0A964FHY6_9CYAN|nr:DUF3110 domain-containing protein [Waterburya agarophytonicola]MCC0177883.1 DUF3110 domain-containing protein [Waterburya agarophytonicola KI4]